MEQNKQQTATEWLAERLIQMIPTHNPLYKKDVEMYLQQANKMHEEQIINAVNSQRQLGWDEKGQQYYNETYGKE
jgi:hypothetical protein